MSHFVIMSTVINVVVTDVFSVITLVMLLVISTPSNTGLAHTIAE